MQEVTWLEEFYGLIDEYIDQLIFYGRKQDQTLKRSTEAFEKLTHANEKINAIFGNHKPVELSLGECELLIQCIQAMEDCHIHELRSIYFKGIQDGMSLKVRKEG